MQGLRVSELAVRHAEENLLDAEPAQLELQGLAGRLAAQQEHHNAVERGLEMQGAALDCVRAVSCMCAIPDA